MSVPPSSKCVAKLPQGVRGRVFGDSRPPHGTTNGRLKNLLVQVVPSHLAIDWVDRDLIGGEYVLPAPFTTCLRVLASQGIGQGRLAIPLCQVRLVPLLYR